MKRLRIGVVGTRFGQWHVRTLLNMPQAHLVAYADRHPTLPAELQGAVLEHEVRNYDDGIEMINTAGLDAVSLCVPPKARAPLIEAALARGVALFIEKPWAANAAQAQQLATLCNNAGVPVMLAFSFRFHPAIVKLRSLLEGELGAPWLVNGEYVFGWLPPAENWLWDPANGGGFINENSCHVFDALNMLLGRPVSVMAEGGAFFGRPSQDAAAISIRYESGALAALTVGGVGERARRDFPRISLSAKNGQAVLQGREHIWHSVGWSTRASSTLHKFELSPEFDRRTRYTDAFEHFFSCIEAGTQPSVAARDGVRTVEMAMAVYESARLGRKVLLAQ